MNCPNCNRNLELTDHHLVPVAKGGKTVSENLIQLCEDCHAHLHSTYSNHELEKVFNTIDSILNDSNMRSFGKFASKQTKRIVIKDNNNRRKRR